MVLEKLLKNCNERPSATNFYNLGVCYSLLGDEEKAVTAYEESIKRETPQKDVLLNLIAAVVDTENQRKLVETTYRHRKILLVEDVFLIRLVAAFAAHENLFMAKLCAGRLHKLYPAENAYEILVQWFSARSETGTKKNTVELDSIVRRQIFSTAAGRTQLDFALCYNRYADAYTKLEQKQINALTAALVSQTLAEQYAEEITGVSVFPEIKPNLIIVITTAHFNSERFLFKQLPKSSNDSSFYFILINSSNHLAETKNCQTLHVKAVNVKDLVNLWRDLNRLGAEKVIFDEIGMSAELQILSCMPWKASTYTSWLHPVTSGSNFIDYYVMGEEMAEKQEAFEEMIIFNGKLGQQLTLEQVLCRLPAQGMSNVFIGVIQNPLKVDAEFLTFCIKILRHVEGSHIRFSLGKTLKTNRHFIRRIRNIFVKAAIEETRWSFAEHATREYYREKLLDCDLIVDTHFWSGGNTTIDALELGIPIICKIGETQRARHTEAILRVLGLERCIADDSDQLLEKIIAFCSSSHSKATFTVEFNKTLCSNHQRLQDSSSRLFDYIASHTAAGNVAATFSRNAHYQANAVETGETH